MVFKRFNPSCLNSISQSLHNLNFDTQLFSDYSTFYSSFNFCVKPFTLPKHFQLCMISLSEGSDTKVMVKNLLEWSKDRQRVFTDSDEEGDDVVKESIFTCKEWANANKRGNEIIKIFQDINELETDPEYTTSVQAVLDKSPKEGCRVSKLINLLKERNNEYRLDLSCITMLSGVQVEPIRATEILNELASQIPECVMIGVPGAGGDDAAYMLYLSTESDQNQVRDNIKTRIDTVNDKLKSECCLLPIQTNTQGPIKFVEES